MDVKLLIKYLLIFVFGKIFFYHKIKMNKMINIKKNKILIIDQYIPKFDNDAGSRSVFQHILAYISLGFDIIFLGDDFINYEPYTTTLKNMNVNVLNGSYYKKCFKNWIKSNDDIDFVIFNRPNIFVKYYNIIKKYTNAKLIYYGHDLHYLRKFREYEITKSIYRLLTSKLIKKIECSILEIADISYFFSQYEIEVIKKLNTSINCKVLPIYIYNKKNINYYNNNGNDLMFVGGFKHLPNVDAILWFTKSIMPIVNEKFKNIKLYIIGADVPNIIKDLENNEIKIVGYLNDIDLEKYYKNCKISIAPLRYGAGLKGKIIEAMYNQIPVITTKIGAEGLVNIDDCIIIEDDPIKFGEKIIDLYNNELKQKKLIKNSYSYIMNNYSIKKFNDIICKDFT